MLILGIETSCDETAAALVRDGVEVVTNVVASSQEMHKKTGGIIPEQAAREQIKCIMPVVEEAIKGYTPEQIDAIAVTYGPGLIGSLLVGIETAKTLAYVWGKPIVPVNHLIGHVYANFIEKIQGVETCHGTSLQNKKIEFPAMVLIVSGGHTELVLMKGHGSFEIVGQTRDDAAGEAYDKVARILGLGYPGGPAIQNASNEYLEKCKNQNAKCKITIQNSKFKLPRPMINSNDLDFSFSGLKTAVLRHVQNVGAIHELPLPEDMVNALAYETQEAITEVLVAKTIKAAEKYNVKSILLAGGVAANKRLRVEIEKIIQNKEKSGERFVLSIPPLALCTDNAATIASAGFFNFKPLPISEIIVDPGLEIV